MERGATATVQSTRNGAAEVVRSVEGRGGAQSDPSPRKALLVKQKKVKVSKMRFTEINW